MPKAAGPLNSPFFSGPDTLVRRSGTAIEANGSPSLRELQASRLDHERRRFAQWQGSAGLAPRPMLVHQFLPPPFPSRCSPRRHWCRLHSARGPANTSRHPPSPPLRRSRRTPSHCPRRTNLGVALRHTRGPNRSSLCRGGWGRPRPSHPEQPRTRGKDAIGPGPFHAPIPSRRRGRVRMLAVRVRGGCGTLAVRAVDPSGLENKPGTTRWVGQSAPA